MNDLSGRIKFQRTSERIRNTIPGRFHWDGLFFGVIVVFFAPTTLQSGASALEIMGACLLGLFGLAVIVFSLKTGFTVISLDRSEMEIGRRQFGIEWSSRRFATSAVRNLGYLPPKWSWLKKGSLPGELCFDSGRKSYRFGAGLESGEARAIIQQMSRIYHFSWDLPDSKE